MHRGLPCGPFNHLLASDPSCGPCLRFNLIRFFSSCFSWYKCAGASALCPLRTAEGWPVGDGAETIAGGPEQADEKRRFSGMRYPGAIRKFSFRKQHAASM
ncbi:unnamed protein product [Hapterophycus canaliculatus]